MKIKNGNQLLVNVSENNGIFDISTKAGQPVELYFPGLKFSNPTVPKILVNFAIKYDAANKKLTDGSILAVPPQAGNSPFDLSQYGIPAKIDTIFYGKINGNYAFRLHSLLKLFGQEFSRQNAVNLFIGSDGKLTSNLNMSIQQTIPMVPGSDKLNLKINNLSGNFDVNLLTSNINFNLSLGSEIRIKVDQGKEVGATATIVASNTGISVQNYQMDTEQLGEIGMDFFKMAIKKIQMPRLEYHSPTDPNPGWDFEFGFDFDFKFPSLGFEIPEVKGITLTKSGLHIPQISIPSFADSLKFQFQGFEFKPLAFRTPSINIDWFSSNPLSIDWSQLKFDFAVNFPNIQNGSGLMQTPDLTIRNAAFHNGILTAQVTKNFNLGDLRLNLGGSTVFNVTKISGELFDNSGSQGVRFGLNGTLDLPDFMKCGGNATADVSSVKFNFDSRGLISGTVTNFVPNCPINLGFGTFTVTNSSIIFAIENNSQSALLDMSGTLNVPTGGGQNVTANGSIKLNLLTGQIADGQIAINGPFNWSIPADNPIFTFTINNATLNKDGLRINGASQLQLEGGATQTVQFNNFLFDFVNTKVKGGNITIAGNIGLKLTVPEGGGINWGVTSKNISLTADKTAMIGFGGTVVIDSAGVHTTGSANAAVRWDASHVYNGLSVAFSNNFAIKIKPFGVKTGRADLMLNADTIAYLDNGGFHLGNIFGLIPLPEKLPLPDTTVAYIKIKDGNNVLLETHQAGSDLQLRTKSGESVKLFIPALKNGSTVPSFDVTFNVTVNTSNWGFVSGGITVAAQEGQSLLDLESLLGIPIKIQKVEYKKIGGSYKLAADAKFNLPQALGGLPVDLSGLSFDQHGLTGTVNIGHFSQTKLSNVNPIARANLGSDVQISLEGATAQFGDNKAFKFSGNIIPLMLVKGTDTSKIHYAAEWDGNNRKFVFSFDFTQGQKFDFGVAEFYPQAINPDPAMQLSFSGSDFEFKMGGTLKIPSFDPNFAIAFKGFKINKSGVSVDAVHIPDVNQALTFELFKSQFRIYDSFPNSQAISFGYHNRVLSLTLSGDVNVLNHVVKFKGFKIATDGTIAIQSVNLISNPVAIIQNYLTLDTLGIKNVSNKYRLKIAGNVKLPPSISQTSSFHYGFEIGTDGHVYSNSTDNRVVFLNETPGLGNGDNSEYKFWQATIDPTYFDLGLNFGDMSKSYVSFLGDIYWGNNASQKVAFGQRNADGTVKQAAFKITFGGNITWGDITVNSPINFDWEMLHLVVNNLSVHPSNNDIAITIGGGFGFNISSVTGNIEISGLKINKSGIEDFGTITQAGLKIASIVDLQLDSLVFINHPTTITVKSGSMPTGNNNSPSSQQQTINVKNYFSFGGRISIANMLSGGIKKFVTYTTVDDQFNLLIQDAFIKYSNVFELHMDLVYQTQGSDFYLLAGASGKIMTYSVTMVGEAGHIQGKDRFGFFVAVDVTIPVGPVVIAGVGGGFFYNPTSETINMVKKLAKLDKTGGTEDKIKPSSDNTKFSIFLFGKFTLVNDKIIMGRVLLTLTNTQFYLDGKVIMLDQKNSIYGTIHLAVDFDAGQFEGNIKVNVNMVSLVKGQGEISAYIYGENTWAVMGKTDIEVLKFISVKSEFFVGPSGFLVALEVHKSFDIWIISIEGAFEAKVWYIQNVSWGMYAKVWIKVEVLGGAAGAKGWLKGALFGTPGNYYMYAAAGLEVHLLFASWEGSVWGKIQNGHTSGGFGADSDMERMIDEAGKTADKAEQAKNDMQNEIQSHTVPTKTFSAEELASAFNQLSNWGRMLKYGSPVEKVIAAIALNLLEELEKSGSHYSYDVKGWEKFVEDYTINTYIGTNAPDLIEFQQKAKSIDSLLSSFSTARANLLNALSQNMEKIDPIQSSFQEVGESPVVSINLSPVQKDANGNVVNQPGFQFDQNIADNNQSALENAQQQAAQYEQKVFARIAKIDKNIDVIEKMLFGYVGTYHGGAPTSSNSGFAISNAGASNLGNVGNVGNVSTLNMTLQTNLGYIPVNNGAEGFSSGYASYFHSIDRAFVEQYKYYKKLQQWASNRRTNLYLNATKVNNFRVALRNKAAAIFDNDWEGLKYLTARRVYFITIVSSNDNNLAETEKQKIISQFDSEHSNKSTSVFRNWAINTNVKYGMNLWIDIPKVGLRGIVDSSGARAASVRDSKLEMLGKLANLQASLTQKMSELYAQLAKFVELKYDLYDRLITRRQGVTEYIDRSISTSYLQSQKMMLANRMKLPVITSLNYKIYDEGYYSAVNLDWSVSGIGSDYARAMIDFTSSNPYFPAHGKQSVGSRKVFKILYLPNSISSSGGGIFGPTTFKLYVKNSLGYVISRQATFTPSCSGEPAPANNNPISGSGAPDNSPPHINKLIAYPYKSNGAMISLSGNIPVIYFTSDTATVNAKWAAYDLESGIREYRYKLISTSSPLASDKGNPVSGNTGTMFNSGNFGVNTQTQTGIHTNTSTMTPPYFDWVNNYGRNNVEIHGLNLLHNHYYKLLVVAKNGDDVWSQDTSGKSQYLLVDTTPPTAPKPQNSLLNTRLQFNNSNFIDGGHRFPGNDNTEGAYTPMGGGVYLGLGGNYTSQHYSVNPPIDLPENVSSYNPTASPGGFNYGVPGYTAYQYYDISKISETFSWKAAEDQESGIDGYEYRIIKKNDNSKATNWFDNQNKLSVTIKSADLGSNNFLNYVDTFYLDVRARNRANKAGDEILRFTFQPIDKTGPTKPEVNMAYSPNHSRIYLVFSQYASDAETGIDHYEVALGSQPNGAMDYLPWSRAITFKPSMIGNDKAYLLPVLPNHTRGYIAVRAVNKQGKPGAICYTGPFYNDNTPPVTPSVIANSYIIYGTTYLGLSFQNLNDPETGIIGVEYKVEEVTYGSRRSGGSASGGTRISTGRGTATYSGGTGMTYGHASYKTLIDWSPAPPSSIVKPLDDVGHGTILRISVKAKNGAMLYSRVYSTQYSIK